MEIQAKDLIDGSTVHCTPLENIKITTHDDAAVIVEAIERVTDLVALSLNGISLGIDGAEAIAKALATKSTLKECDWGNCFKSRLLEEIPPALMHLADGLEQSGARIRKLDLSDNAFGPNGARGVKPILVTDACLEIEELHLENCGLGVAGGEIIGSALEILNDNIRKNGLTPKLRIMRAGRNRQEVGGSAALAKGFGKLGSLEEVFLIQNGITWKGVVKLAEAFKLCPMTKINLNDNILTQKGACAIAEAVQCLPDLIELDLGDCLIRTEGALRLATALKSCKKIKKVNFAFGEIKIDGALALVNSLPLDQLELLDLNGNKFGDEGCDQLQKLTQDHVCFVGDLEDDDDDVSDSENENAITDSEDEDECYQNSPDEAEINVMEELRFGCMKHVEVVQNGNADQHVDDDQYNEPLESNTTVDFLGRGLKVDTASDAAEIVAAINAIPSLVTLRLSGNTLSPDATAVIATALQGRNEVQHLLLSDIFTGRLKDEIPRSIQLLNDALNFNESKCRLRTLDLSDNAFGPNGAVAVEPFLNSKCCMKLQYLKLNNNGLGTFGARMIASGLSDLAKLTRDNGQKLMLKEFICGRNRLEVPGTQALAAVFEDLGTLEVIEIPQNGIQPEGIAALAAGLKTNSNLRMLNINDNTVTERGVSHLVNSFNSCSKLEKLDLGDCLLRSDGAKTLSSKLSELKLLRSINLSYNEINAASGKIVVQAVCNNDRLESLNLNGNQFGQNGCDDILQIMKMNNAEHKLEPLDEDNDVEDETDLEEYDEEDNKENVSIEDFLHYPNVDGFLALGPGRDEIILSKCPDSISLSRTAIRLATASTKSKISEKTAITVQQTIEQLLRKLFSDYDVLEATTDLLTECGLLKAEDKARRLELTTNPPDLKNIFFFLKGEVTKNYFPSDSKKYILTFVKRKGVKVLEQADGPDKSELIARLYKF